MSDEPLPRMFFSTFHYAACKEVGTERWPDVLRHLMAHPTEGPDVLGTRGWSFLTFNECRYVAETRLHVASNSYIARARCVAAAHFLRGEGNDCDVWVTCDDDTFADRGVLRRLVTACRATRGLVALPCANRDGHTMCMRKVSGPTEWWREDVGLVVASEDAHPSRLVTDALPLRRVDRVGQGLVAMHRDLIEALDAECPRSLRFRDRIAPDALDCPGIFLSLPHEGDWVGEDYYLCALAEKANLSRHVLLEADVQHESLMTRLDLEGQVLIVGAEKARAMAEAIETMNRQAQAVGLQET